jgi:hypothetical protein
MGTLERTETLTHRIGVDGRVSIKAVAGSLRIRGVAGEDATLSVTYRIRAGDQATAERALDGGRVLVDRGPGSLEVETPERRLATGLTWLFGGGRVSADLTLDVPFGARVRLETMSGSIEAVGLVGEQKYRTMAGDVRLWSLGGTVEAGTLSGSVRLDGGGDVRLRATTVSGSVRVRAARFHGMVLSTTSGSIAAAGALDPDGDYRAESISGNVELTPLSGVTAELRSISGSLVSKIGGRVEGGRGSWRVIIGDGRAVFRVSSTSGGLRLAAAGPDASTAFAQAGPGAPVPPAAPVQPVPPAPPVVPVPPAPPAEAVAGSDAASGASAAEPVPVVEPSPVRSADDLGTWNPDDAADAAPAGASDDELAVLQALERGDIGVDEAAERLESFRGQRDV